MKVSAALTDGKPRLQREHVWFFSASATNFENKVCNAVSVVRFSSTSVTSRLTASRASRYPAKPPAPSNRTFASIFSVDLISSNSLLSLCNAALAASSSCSSTATFEVFVLHSVCALAVSSESSFNFSITASLSSMFIGIAAPKISRSCSARLSTIVSSVLFLVEYSSFFIRTFISLSPACTALSCSDRNFVISRSSSPNF